MQRRRERLDESIVIIEEGLNSIVALCRIQ
jgi:hypothetical protein